MFVYDESAVRLVLTMQCRKICVCAVRRREGHDMFLVHAMRPRSFRDHGVHTIHKSCVRALHGSLQRQYIRDDGVLRDDGPRMHRVYLVQAECRVRNDTVLLNSESPVLYMCIVLDGPLQDSRMSGRFRHSVHGVLPLRRWDIRGTSLHLREQPRMHGLSCMRAWFL